MHWSWAQYEETPTEVVTFLIDKVTKEQEERQQAEEREKQLRNRKKGRM